MDIPPSLHAVAERVAAQAHDTATRDRLAAGWRHGQEPDEAESIDPRLVPFPRHPEADQLAARDAALRAPDQAVEQPVGEVILAVFGEKQNAAHQAAGPALPARRSTRAPSTARVSRYLGNSQNSAQLVSCTVPKGKACR